ncbi:glyoxalase domain protein [Natronomonas pharaonis DSM 2160]|uniref:Glyoxalase domain protein n=1 Tax=Natronomonas pharaonis (strain ATCC 35678 / DSM 2160 / CIP 103997 / JCM 8858 / NBRC 14720 / NCIMB 2260 / Gabara) TaxID=348780 RepID=A0A1U7EYJ2_NATPD|nr:VOC family protein [Natronomonas pharaonis]CAI50321.1 glyoxalase domain protein [Natronomonas pharaonis DSM 2160]
MDGILDHTMIRVEDLDASLEWYTTHLNYEEKGRWEAETFTNVYLGPEDAGDAAARLELTYNHDGRSYTMGDAWGHIAVRVPDVEAAYDELMQSGVEDYRPPAENPGYAFVTDPDGHEVEIVERDYGTKWSLDHTMLRVEDVNAALGYWIRTFEYEPTGRWEADSFANYFVSPQDAPAEAMDIELTYNYDGRSYTMGDAWGHVAVRCADLQSAWETLQEREAPDYRDPESCDNRYAFTKAPDGHEIEILPTE